MRPLLLGSLLLCLVGCTMLVIPTRRNQDFKVELQRTPPPPAVIPDDMAIATPDSSSTPTTTTPISHALIHAEDGHTTCKPYVPPTHAAPPATPQFTDAERIDPNKLNIRLVGYVGELRDYILQMLKSDNDAYTQYQRSCKTLSDDDSQTNP